MQKQKEQETLPALCEEQEAALKRIVETDKRATVLTGCAGSGKSVLMRTLMQRHPELFTITSTTARSALHVGGVTIDRLFSLNRDTWRFRNYSKMEQNLQVIGPFVIIDEASMVGSKMAELIMSAADHGKKKIILCGDWAQASPVKDEWPLGHELFKKADIIFLRECHRQHDKEFLEALNDIRVGKVTDRSYHFFASRVVEQDTDEKDVVKMYATNKKVDTYNHYRLEKHAKQKKRVIFRTQAHVTDERSDYARDNYALGERERERLLSISPVAHNEPLSAGCRVIVTYNIPNSNYRGQPGEEIYTAVNGDTGILQRVDNEETPTQMNVQLDRTNKTVHIRRVAVEVYGYSTGTPDYTIRGFPIRLGYAITIHKSQGMTLEKVEVDMASMMNHPEDSRHGLAYVAFSRARTPEGLGLLNWRKAAVYSNPIMSKLIMAAGAKV